MDDHRSKLMRGLLEALILARLEDGPVHGYGILKVMEDLFGADVNKNRVYPLLQRLESEGIIERVEQDENDDGGRPRQDYMLTDDGRERLAGYRGMPEPFRDMMRQFWAPRAGTGAVPDGGSAPAAGAIPVAAPSVPVAPPASTTTTRVPVRFPGSEGAPYPCPDARVHLEKDPSSGELAIRLTGCPMGAYEYCPECPIWKATEGYRRLVFG